MPRGSCCLFVSKTQICSGCGGGGRALMRSGGITCPITTKSCMCLLAGAMCKGACTVCARVGAGQPTHCPALLPSLCSPHLPGAAAD